MSLRRSYTAIVERNVLWQGEYASEPYEAAWASEAIFFVRALEDANYVGGIATVQISADGIHWIDEAHKDRACRRLRKTQVTFCKVAHFGGWLAAQAGRIQCQASRIKGPRLPRAERVNATAARHTAVSQGRDGGSPAALEDAGATL